MSITEKDNRLIELVEQWGFLTALDIQMFLDVKMAAANWRVRRLVDLGLLKCESAKVTREYVFLSRNARHGVNPLEFNHSQIAKRLAVFITNQTLHNPDPEAPKIKQVITERQLMHEAALESGILGLSRKLPDFILEFNNGYKRAVEVELTAKHRPILKKHIGKCGEAVFKGQANDFLYICGTEAIRQRVATEAAAQGLQTVIQTALLPENIMNYQGGWPWPPVD